MKDFEWWPDDQLPEDDVRKRLEDLIEVVSAFLKRKATIGELRQALRRAKKENSSRILRTKGA